MKKQEEEERRRRKYFKQQAAAAKRGISSSSDSDSSDSDDSNDSDDSDDDSNDSDSDDTHDDNNRYPDLPPAIAAALNELHDSLDEAQAHAAMLKDEWGNKVSVQETQQREKVCKAIRRKMDKWFLKASGAKFEPFRQCEKAVHKIAAKFEKKLAMIIADANARRESQKRAKRRLDLFNEEQDWYSTGARYDQPAATMKMDERPPGTLGPELRCKPGGRLFWRPWKEPGRSKVLTFSWGLSGKGDACRSKEKLLSCANSGGNTPSLVSASP